MLQPTPEIISAFAPNGVLRASINLGNPILANKSSESGLPFGVSVDLAQGLAKLLGVGIELLAFDTAAKSVDAVAQGRADVGFFAIDPVRGADIAFTAPYVLIEGCYAVRQTSSLESNDQVDVAGQSVVVGAGSAYDLFLTRELKHARIVRAPSSPAVIEIFMDQNLEVAAGVKQQLEADIQRYLGLRLLPGRFMVIQQAMGVQKSRGSEAAKFLHQYVESQKSCGFVGNSLALHKIRGASVAPLIGV